MSRLALTADDHSLLRKRLLEHDVETCAILLGREVRVGGVLARLVVSEIIWPDDQDYSLRSGVAAQLRPEMVARVAKRARASKASLVFVHSHPFALNEFSEIDDHGEAALKEFLDKRIPGVIHAAMLVTQQVTLSRVLGTKEPLDVVGVGPRLEWGASVVPLYAETAAQFDRQARIFGQEGQARLAHLRIGIVGLGGTGSIVAQELAHLGVVSFLLMDPDRVEATNLNRLVGATMDDVGRSKVDVAANLIRRIQPNARVAADPGSALINGNLAKLVDVDFIFACTDSHGSRAVLNQLSYQYLVPLIDVGVIISLGGAMQVAGRTQMLSPGLGCMICGNLLNPEQVRVDLLTDFERQTDPYIPGLRTPAPAVISLNGTMSSMAVTMFMAAVLGLPSQARLINYNGNLGTIRAARITADPKCYVCSRAGATARATEWPHAGRPSP